MAAYPLTLICHSYLRWGVVLLLCALGLRALRGYLRAAAWTRGDERLHRALMAVVDLQFTLGLLLYVFLSPLSHAFLAEPGSAIEAQGLRFFGLEHPTMMLLATGIVHAGRSRSKKAATPKLRHRRVFATSVTALLVLAAAIPWPGLGHGRPLLRTPTAAMGE